MLSLLFTPDGEKTTLWPDDLIYIDRSAGELSMVRIFRPSKNSLTQLEIGALRKRQTYILVGHEEADDAWTPENVASVLLIKDKKLVSLVETNLFKMGYRVLPN